MPGPAPGERSDLLVVGAGLIGTSVALAARAAGYEVWVDDRDPVRVSMAVSVGAGRPVMDRTGRSGECALAVVAVSPADAALVVHQLISSSVASIVTHVSSVQTEPQLKIELLSPRCGRFVGSHPIAGRERSGPHHASADLFAQRPWVVCPTEHSSVAAQDAVRELAAACGAIVSVMSAQAHDALLARLSHAPQLLASALAGALIGMDRRDAALAGSGLRDTSRLADSEPELWAEIVAANPGAVAAALRAVTGPLEDLIDILESADPAGVADGVRALITRGRQGRALLAGKHGQAAVRWASVSVVVPDEPGALARLLVDAADARVNVEDIRVDHAPGQPVGVVELDVASGQGEALADALRARTWSATANLPAAD
jgi:prephenate dehydrogenase